MSKSPSLFLEALACDNSLPIEQVAVDLWLKDLQNPRRWWLRPILQFVFTILLHIVWFLKCLPLPQFSAHKPLQQLICWFCKHFVSPEANTLILRHYATESNVLNFLADNTPGNKPVSVELYPQTIDQMIAASFVDHDQELFRMMKELGHWTEMTEPTASSALNWTNWKPLDLSNMEPERKWTQVFDFESAHALFMCIFCLLLTRQEYRDAINGFNLDQSIAIRIGQIIGDPSMTEMAYNQFPLYLQGPKNLGQRFLLHGFFTEFAYARLEAIRLEA